MFLCGIALLTACANEKEVEGNVVYASIEPQAYLLERIAGDLVDVRVLIPATQNHHTFEATPRQVAALSTARLYFTVGLPFEERIVEQIRAIYADLTVVDTTEDVDFIELEDEHDHGDHHDHDEECAHGSLDPHVWLGPPELRRQARTIAAALMQAFPEHEQAFEFGLEEFLADLEALDHRIADQLEPHRGKAFFVFHPAFGYFAHAYGLEQRAVEIDGKSPSPRQIQELIADAREAGVKTIFIQPQFDVHSATIVADAIGGAVATLDPNSRDVLATLQMLADQLDAGFSDSE